MSYSCKVYAFYLTNTVRIVVGVIFLYWICFSSRMLTPEVVKRIESFVQEQPRSIDEIAKLLKKNWRTADRYVKEIAAEHSTLSIKVFREGSRGALKVVYYSSMDQFRGTVFQEALEHDILAGKKKDDFSEFDIYQHVPEGRKKASVESAENVNSTDFTELADIIRDTKKELLIFSGNMSFINLKNKNVSIYTEFDKLVKRGVRINAVCNIDLAGKANVEKMLSLNFRNGKQMIEVRHREQPLRGMISDTKIIRIKEVKEPTGKIHELNKRIFIFYTIRDNDWAKWLSRVFWKMFSTSVEAKKRIDELKKLE